MKNTEWTRKNIEKAEKWANMTIDKLNKELEDDEATEMDNDQSDLMEECVSILHKCLHMHPHLKEAMCHEHMSSYEKERQSTMSPIASVR